MNGVLLTPRKGELIAHVGINDKAIDEILNDPDPDLEKEFRKLLFKFVADNFTDYRFYSNTVQRFRRQNDVQFYGDILDNLQVGHFLLLLNII